MNRPFRTYLTLIAASFLLVLAACGGDDDGDAAEDDGGGDAESTSQPTATSNSGGGGGGGGGGAGQLTLGDEVIDLDSARCFLQEQDVPGSAGKILFSVQGNGTLADGTDFVLDVSRYDEDSPFTGDDIQVDVGDPFGDDFFEWITVADLGTVSLDGSTLSATGLTLRSTADQPIHRRLGAFRCRS